MKSREESLRELVELFDQGVSAQRLLRHLIDWAGQVIEQGKSPGEAKAEVESACVGDELTAAAEAWEKALGSKGPAPEMADLERQHQALGNKERNGGRIMAATTATRVPHLRVDRTFPGVGRINMVTGATTRAELRRWNELLTFLWEKGMLDVLRAIRAHTVTLHEVFNAYHTDQLNYVAADLVLNRNLKKAVEAWLPVSARAPRTRQRSAESFTALWKYGPLGDGATIRDLKAVDWAALNNSWPTGPAGWNRMRAAVSTFLTMVLGDKWHDFRRAVMVRMPRREEPEGRVPELSPGEFWKIIEQATPALRPCYVTLAVAGLGPGEFLRATADDLVPTIPAIRVHGTKHGRQGVGLVRLAPSAWVWVEQAVPCSVTVGVLRDHWDKALLAVGRERGSVRLYDLRHCYGQWLSEAGAPEAHIQVGLRHRSPAMTRRYTKQRDAGQNAALLERVLFGPAPGPATASARKAG